METKKGRKRASLKYFYLNGELHKRLHIHRGADQITTWNYPKEKRVVYTYSDVKRNQRPCFTTAEVAEMISRAHDTILDVIMRGEFDPPQYTYGLTELRQKFQYMWSEEDIMNLHAYFSSIHKGRPRNDGKITPAYLPSPRELRAMINQEEVLYVKSDDGEFIPAWRAQDFS